MGELRLGESTPGRQTDDALHRIRRLVVPSRISERKNNGVANHVNRPVIDSIQQGAITEKVVFETGGAILRILVQPKDRIVMETVLVEMIDEFREARRPRAGPPEPLRGRAEVHVPGPVAVGPNFERRHTQSAGIEDLQVFAMFTQEVEVLYRRMHGHAVERPVVLAMLVENHADLLEIERGDDIRPRSLRPVLRRVSLSSRQIDEEGIGGSSVEQRLPKPQARIPLPGLLHRLPASHCRPRAFPCLRPPFRRRTRLPLPCRP